MNSALQRKSGQTKNQFDLGEIFTIIWRRKWMIFIPMIIVSAVTYAGSYFLPPVYETSVIIWVGNTLRLSDGLQRLVGDDLNAIGSSRNRRDELRSLQNEITSTPYIRQLVQILKLDENPELDRRAERLRAERSHVTKEQIKFNLLLEDLRDRITIDFSGQDQVEIAVESPNPHLAQDMAQNLGEIFISEKMKQRMGAVRVSQDFSFEQLEKYERDLQNKIAARTEFEREYLKVQLDDVIVSDENRRSITSEIEATRVEITDLEDEVRQLMAKITGIPSNRLVLTESDDIKRAKGEIQRLLRTISEMMRKYQWNSPEVLNFKGRLYSQIDQIEAENRRLVAEQYAEQDNATRVNLVQLFNNRSQLDMLYSRANSLELALTDLNNKIALIPEYQARLDQLGREVGAARDLRDRMRTQQESSQISQAIVRESEFTVIQPAQLPLEPIFPDKRKLLIMGILLGLAVGGGITFLVELLDNSFRKIEDVEEFLRLPVVGVIPDIEAVKRAHLR